MDINLLSMYSVDNSQHKLIYVSPLQPSTKYICAYDHVYIAHYPKKSSTRKFLHNKWFFFTCKRTSFTILSANPCWHAYMRLVQPPRSRLQSFDFVTPLIGDNFMFFLEYSRFTSIAFYKHFLSLMYAVWMHTWDFKVVSFWL